MLTRRLLLQTTAAGMLLAGLPRLALAQSSDGASAFVNTLLHDLVGIVNASSPTAQKKAALEKIVDRDVDIDNVARFCLGRYWRLATPAQQKEYTTLFHTVLVRNITGNVDGYKGVTFTVGRSQPREGATAVTSIVTRPGNAPNNVQWLVSTASGSPKIIDVIAEGTSLRLTQRSDYTSYLSRNNDKVQALIDAMRRQTS
jgi:phospholipid transport system substrate-binding protein